MTSTTVSRTLVRRLPDFNAPAALPTPRGTPGQPAADGPGAPSPDIPTGSTAAAPARMERSEPSPAHQYVYQSMRRIMEVLDGRRPAMQLAGVVTAPVLRYLVASAGRLDEPRLHASLGGRPRRRQPARARRHGVGLRSMRVYQPTDQAAEVSVVWRYRGRFRAMAARFELTTRAESALTTCPVSATDARWQCTALRIG